jgi:hypothetical protein
MFAIRDSEEPEDSLDVEDAFPSAPDIAMPIVFDLPSTTTIDVNSSLSKSKTPVQQETQTEKPTNGEEDDVWDFARESPARLSPSKSVFDSPHEQVQETKKPKRRNPVAGIDTAKKSKKPVIHDSPVAIRTKRKQKRRIEESDEENVDVDEVKDMGDCVEVADEFVRVESCSPTKRATIAVEIPSRKSKRSKKKKEPLEEIILVQNVTTTPSPPTSPQKIDIAKTEKPIKAINDTAGNVDISTNQNLVREVTPPVALSKKLPMSPQGVKVATILAKGGRPAYRVGLSRRVNVESLHSYLKKTV